METLMKFMSSLYMMGDWLMVVSWSLAGTETSTVILFHIIATVIAISAGKVLMR